MTDDVRKLLGGYATGTLTEAEREQLFSAALDDQALFEALADEQALADLLEDSSARTTLLHATENPEFRPATVFQEWFSRPKSKVLVALGCIAFVSIVVQRVQQLRMPQDDLTAPQIALNTPSPADRQLRQEALRELPAVPPRAKVGNATGTAAQVQKKAKDKSAEATGTAAGTAPPPPAVQTADAESATRTVTAAGVELQYTLLRRTAEGADVAVPASYTFAPNDRVRLRVQASDDGMFEIRRDGAPMYTGGASAGTPIVVPAELAFTEAAMHTVDIRFTPLPRTGVSRMEFRDNAQAPAPAAPAARAVSVAPQGSVSTQIILRRATQ